MIFAKSCNTILKHLMVSAIGLLFLTSACDTKDAEIVFATYTYSTNDRLANLEPLAEHLSESTGLNIRAVSYPTVEALISAVADGSADFAMMNTSGYLVLQRNHPGAATPLVNLTLGNGLLTNYGGCIIARKDLGINTMDDVVSTGIGLSLALVTATSTSGNLVPRLLLNSHGVPDAEAIFNVTYSGTHRQVVEDVLSGKAMLGGSGCAEIEIARDQLGFDDIAVVVSSFDDIPLGPIVYGAKTDKDVVAKIAARLESLHIDNPDVFANFCAGWSEFREATQFMKVADSDYDSFRQMFGTNTALWMLIE